MEGDEKNYDYIAIPYPEGYIDSETMFLFMQEDIENVSFVGFVDVYKRQGLGQVISRRV